MAVLVSRRAKTNKVTSLSKNKEEDWLKRLARADLQYEELVCGGKVFTKKPFFDWVNGERVGVSLFVPDSSWRQRRIVRTDDISEYSQARRQAHLLRRAIVDPTIPYELPLINGDHIIFRGGRYSDASLLGSIKYAPALPELLEVAGHDYDKTMRQTALESIKEIGKPARKHAARIAEILYTERSAWVKQEVAELLGVLKNPIVLPRIREELEEARLLAARYFDMGYLFGEDRNKSDLCSENAYLFEKLLITLFKMDPSSGREELAKSFNYGSPVINHHAKNAVFWTGAKQRIIIPKNGIQSDSKFIDVPFTFKTSPDKEEF